MEVNKVVKKAPQQNTDKKREKKEKKQKKVDNS